MPPSPSPIDRLLTIMAQLRDPKEGCPWDVEQNFATIAPYTIEEAYEVADAIERDDMDGLKDELGDLLLQVVFHAQMAAEDGTFDFADVAETISEKMVRRHPNVFGDLDVPTAAAQLTAWESHKEAERAAKAAGDAAPPSALEGVALALPALMRAYKLQRRAARVGFDWHDLPPVIAKIEEELDEIRAEIAADAPADRLEDEVGDFIFAAVNLARHLDVDPEQALRRANAKFDRRFRRVETLLGETGRTTAESSLDEMDALWNVAKEEEGSV